MPIFFKKKWNISTRRINALLKSLRPAIQELPRQTFALLR